MSATRGSASVVLGRSTVWVIFALFFLIASSAVFFGFIGYYSRVSLSNDLRQKKDDASVDLLFMFIEQIARDESALMEARQRNIDDTANANREAANLRAKALASDEFAAYSKAKARIVKLFGDNRGHLTDDYWSKLSESLFSN